MISILANWGSGATLFSQLLDNHEDITCNGEIFTNNVDGLCSCGELFNNCNFLKSAGSEFHDGTHFEDSFYRATPDFNTDNKLIRRLLNSCVCAGSFRNFIINRVPKFSKARNEFIEKHLHFAERANDLNKSSIYIDGSKSVRRCELFLEQQKIKKVLYLIRDPRSQMTSTINKSLDFDFRLNSITTYHKEVMFLRNFYTNAKFMVVRYEDLCENPETCLKKVSDFLGLAYVSEMLEITTDEKHFFGSTRVRNKKFSSIKKHKEKWPDILTQAELKKINSKCRDMLAEFYP